MVTTSLDIELAPIGGSPRPLEQWLTTFPLAPVILDPFTHESAWILETARRILITYRGAGCRTCWIVTCNEQEAGRFLGPYADELLTFTDPARSVVRSLGIEYLPAFMLIRHDGSVAAAAQGWDPLQWREVAAAISEMTEWNRPVIGDLGDPAAYPGTPAGV